MPDTDTIAGNNTGEETNNNNADPYKDRPNSRGRLPNDAPIEDKVKELHEYLDAENERLRTNPRPRRFPIRAHVDIVPENDEETCHGLICL